MKQKKITIIAITLLLTIFGVGCANTSETEEVATIEKQELDIHVEPTQEIYETKDETVKTKDLMNVHANDYEGDILFYPLPYEIDLRVPQEAKVRVTVLDENLMKARVIETVVKVEGEKILVEDENKEDKSDKKETTSTNKNDNKQTQSTANNQKQQNTTTQQKPNQTQAQQTQATTQQAPVQQQTAPAQPAHTHNWVALTQTVNHPAEYKTVYHDATYKQVWVQDSAAWDEPVMEYRVTCNGCGAQLLSYDAWVAHDNAMIEQGDFSHGAYHTGSVQVGTIHHETTGHYENQVATKAWSENVLVKNAWSENVVVGYQCSTCGARK